MGYLLSAMVGDEFYSPDGAYHGISPEAFVVLMHLARGLLEYTEPYSKQRLDKGERDTPATAIGFIAPQRWHETRLSSADFAQLFGGKPHPVRAAMDELRARGFIRTTRIFVQKKNAHGHSHIELVDVLHGRAILMEARAAAAGHLKRHAAPLLPVGDAEAPETHFEMVDQLLDAARTTYVGRMYRGSDLDEDTGRPTTVSAMPTEYRDWTGTDAEHAVTLAARVSEITGVALPPCTPETVEHPLRETGRERRKAAADAPQSSKAAPAAAADGVVSLDALQKRRAQTMAGAQELMSA